MRITGEYVVLARQFLHDSITDQMTIVGIIEVVAASEFPSQWFGFGVLARLRADVAPALDATVDVRIVRMSAGGDARTVAEHQVLWRAGTSYARIVTHFHYLELERPERLLFRVEWRRADGDWEEGPATSLDIVGVSAV